MSRAGNTDLHGGTYAVVLGGAECVWRDLLRLEAMVGGRWPGLVIAVNDVGCVFNRRIDHWVTLHPEKLPQWEALREENGHAMGYTTWTKVGRVRGRADREIRQWNGGSSGLLAVKVAYELELTHVVLCGTPMDRRPHFELSPVHEAGKDWTAYVGHRRGWTRRESELVGWVKSMSGWTRGFLGAPTRDWLEGNHGDG